MNRGVMKEKSSDFEQLLAPTVEGMGFALWGIELQSRRHSTHLCVYIDSEDGVTIDDCAEVSNQIEGLLEVNGFFLTDFSLEVSSPGMDRILFKPEQYQSHVGEEIDVRLLWPLEGQTHFRGRLNSCNSEHFCIQFDQSEFTFEFEQVHRTRIIPSLN